jgi:hypothetical protein
VLTTLMGWMRPRHDLVLENLLLRHQLTVLTRPTRARPRARLRIWDTLLWILARPIPRRLAWAPEVRDARHGRALASAGLAPVLALEVPVPRRTSASQSRATELDRDDVPRQPAVGHRADQRRAAEAGRCGQQSLDSRLSVARTSALTQPARRGAPSCATTPTISGQSIY